MPSHLSSLAHYLSLSLSSLLSPAQGLLNQLHFLLQVARAISLFMFLPCGMLAFDWICLFRYHLLLRQRILGISTSSGWLASCGSRLQAWSRHEEDRKDLQDAVRLSDRSIGCSFRMLKSQTCLAPVMVRAVTVRSRTDGGG